MKFLFILFLWIPTVHGQFSQNSYVPSTKILKAKGYQLGLSADSFTTQERVDEDGKKEELADGSSFNRFQTEVSGLYGATNDLQFSLGLRFRRNMAKYMDDNEEVIATGSGLESTFVGFHYAFEMVDRMQYTLEGVYRYIAHTNAELDESERENLILGDIGSEISGGIGVTYFAKNNNFFTVRGGLRSPGSDLSDEFYWQVEGAMAWRYLALVAGVDGITSMKNDPYEATPEERPVYNSQTNLYGSVNREWVAPYAGLNFAIGDTWRIELKGSQVVSGISTDLGTTFGVNLIKRADKSATRIMDSKFKTYDIEASVTKVSPKKEYVVIDKGITDDIRKGMRIDFFEYDYIGGNVLVASGIVAKLRTDSAIVKITQQYNLKKEIKEGLIGRASID